MRCRIFLLGLLVLLVPAGPAQAKADAPPAELSAECVAADAAVVGKLEPIRIRQGVNASLPLGDVLAALSRARALCRAGEPERGLLVYLRISDALANALAAAARAQR
jgi:hypothetical protein